MRYNVVPIIQYLVDLKEPSGSRKICNQKTLGIRNGVFWGAIVYWLVKLIASKKIVWLKSGCYVVH